VCLSPLVMMLGGIWPMVNCSEVQWDHEPDILLRILQRIGVVAPRATLANRMNRAVELIQPLALVE